MELAKVPPITNLVFYPARALSNYGRTQRRQQQPRGLKKTLAVYGILLAKNVALVFLHEYCI